jgi:hypothetical protein
MAPWELTENRQGLVLSAMKHQLARSRIAALYWTYLEQLRLQIFVNVMQARNIRSSIANDKFCAFSLKVLNDVFCGLL